MIMLIKIVSSSHLWASILQIMLLAVTSCLYSQQALSADLGRLFTTAAERHALDKLRRENRPQNDIIDREPAEKKAKLMVYNGIITRSNGDKQIWINGKQVKGGKGPEGIRIYKGPDRHHRVTVTVPEKNRVVKIKPGQYWNLESGKIADFDSVPAKKAADTAKPQG